MHLPARSTDPQTSFEAAERVVEFAGKHSEQILRCLQHFGELSKDEISDLTGLAPVQVDRRLPELESKHLAEPTGETRLSHTGRRERVWRKAA